MKNLVLFIAIFIMPIQSAFCNWPDRAPADTTAYRYLLVSKDTYSGDWTGQFAGDSVALLENGSAWKVHPRHTRIFREWQIGDTVHVGFRTSYYFFKREHKCTLYNHDRKEEVYVMLLDSPMKLVDLSEPYFKGRAGIQRLKLNDLSQWLIIFATNLRQDNYLSGFNIDCPVQICVNQCNNENEYYVIVGTGKNGIAHRCFMLKGA